MKTYKVEITGITALMHHKMTDEQLFGLLGARASKKKTKEVRTPREIAEQHAYKTKDGKYYIPLSYVSGAFAQIASDYKQSNSQRKSYKAIAGGIFRPLNESAILLTKDGKEIKDFEVDVRKATNHQRGAVAVCRPRFDDWKCLFEVAIDEGLIAPEIVLEMLNDAGKRSGIGSFRVSKSGYFGQFSVTNFQEMKS
jgi:hypothetical protein